MSDGRAWALPDLPIGDHPSTYREKVLHDETQEFCRDLERHRERLLAVVLGGRDTWRTRARSVWRGLKIDDAFCDALFAYFELQACPPLVQRQLLAHAQNPQKWAELVDAARPGLEVEHEQLKLMAKWS